jgi:hypothetical protein
MRLDFLEFEIYVALKDLERPALTHDLDVQAPAAAGIQQRSAAASQT